MYKTEKFPLNLKCGTVYSHLQLVVDHRWIGLLDSSIPELVPTQKFQYRWCALIRIIIRLAMLSKAPEICYSNIAATIPPPSSETTYCSHAVDISRQWLQTIKELNSCLNRSQVSEQPRQLARLRIQELFFAFPSAIFASLAIILISEYCN